MLDTDETIKRLDKERREIVARYDQGADKQEYLSIPTGNVDKYGFFGPNAVEQAPNKTNKTLSKREDQWNKMTKNWAVAVRSFKIPFRAYKGVPDSQRSVVWAKMLDIDSVKYPNRGVYQRMKDRARESSPEIRQIDLDVNRTFRQNSCFCVRYCPRQQMLFNVLAAYSAYNTEIGYCQGMNNLAAILTMYFPEEEDVFWGLAQLMTGSKWRMHGFYTSGFPKYVRFEKYFDRILRLQFPHMKSHMDELGVGSSMYLVKWFMNCFIDVVPFSLTLRIMDVYFLFGEKMLLATAFTIFRIHRESLISCKTIDSFLEFIGSTQLAVNFGGVSDDRAMKKLRRYYLLLDKLNLLPSPALPEDEKPHCPFAPDHSLSKDEIVRRATRSQMLLTNGELSRSTNSISPLRLDTRPSIRSTSDNGVDDLSTVPESDTSTIEEEWDLVNDIMPDKPKLSRYPSVYDNLNDDWSLKMTSHGTDTVLRRFGSKVVYAMVEGARLKTGHRQLDNKNQSSFIHDDNTTNGHYF